LKDRKLYVKNLEGGSRCLFENTMIFHLKTMFQLHRLQSVLRDRWKDDH